MYQLIRTFLHRKSWKMKKKESGEKENKKGMIKKREKTEEP